MPDPFDFGPEFLGKVPLFAEIQRLLHWDGGPVNWTLANQIAVARASSAQGAGAQAVDPDAADAAWSHASLLISEVAELEPGTIRLVGPVDFAEAISRDAAELFEAIAARASGGLTEGVLPGLPPGFDQALRQLGPMMQGAQAGHVIGATAASALGWSDLGLVIEREGPLLSPIALRSIVRDGEHDERGALLAAMLVVGVEHAVASTFSTLRTRFLSAVLDLVATLEHDVSRFAEGLAGLDPSDPSKIEALLSGGLELERSPASDAAAARADALSALHVAATDRLVAACAARAGLDPSLHAACTAGRRSDETVALRGMLGLPELGSARAHSFVADVVAEGGFELLRRALDDPLAAPDEADLADPAAWLERNRG